MTSATTAPRSRSEWHQRLTAEERALRTERREARNAEARRLRSAGMTFADIGKRLGISLAMASFVAADTPHRPRIKKVADAAEALNEGGTRARALALLARSFPIPADALMSIIRDDAALGISIVRRSASAV